MYLPWPCLRSRSFFTALLLASLATLLACQDEPLLQLCVEEEPGFDIEELSILEDATDFASGRDAITVRFDPSTLPDKATWRVATVDVLLMIPASQFAFYPEGVGLTLEVFDADDPTQVQPWRVSQVLDKSALSFEEVELRTPDNATELRQMRAWWRFDFRDVIPTEGMTASRFLVGAAWAPSGLPAIGYSNYNRSCSENWTQYPDTQQWVLNSELDQSAGENTCSWPMLRVNVETRVEAEDCGG